MANSNIQKNVIKSNEFEQSTDSIQLVRTVESTNLMTVKIPQKKMGEFLIALEPYVLFLNHRQISADDVTLDFDFHDLEKQRLDKSVKKLDIITDLQGKITDKSEIISKTDDKIKEKNEAIIENKGLQDKVNMSEVTLQINENPKITSTTIPNTAGIHLKYHANFGHRISQTFSSGIYYFSEIFFGLAIFWPFILLGLLAFFVLKYAKRKLSIK